MCARPDIGIAISEAAVERRRSHTTIGVIGRMAAKPVVLPEPFNVRQRGSESCSLFLLVTPPAYIHISKVASINGTGPWIHTIRNGKVPSFGGTSNNAIRDPPR